MIDFSFDLFKKKPVIGVDEVGRGAWAGPVFAGAAFLKYKNVSCAEYVEDIKDKAIPNNSLRKKERNTINLL